LKSKHRLRPALFPFRSDPAQKSLSSTKMILMELTSTCAGPIRPPCSQNPCLPTEDPAPTATRNPSTAHTVVALRIGSSISSPCAPFAAPAAASASMPREPPTAHTSAPLQAQVV
jgi:hypothetical protein